MQGEANQLLLIAGSAAEVLQCGTGDHAKRKLKIIAGEKGSVGLFFKWVRSEANKQTELPSHDTQWQLLHCVLSFFHLPPFIFPNILLYVP